MARGAGEGGYSQMWAKGLSTKCLNVFFWKVITCDTQTSA
jgi:hypothetical protein